MSKQLYARIDECGDVEIIDALADGFLPYVETERPVSAPGVIPHNYRPIFQEKNGKVVQEWEAYPNYEEIERLKKKLTDTDYRIIKCTEASLLQEPVPYDVAELCNSRQQIRNEINRLEECR